MPFITLHAEISREPMLCNIDHIIRVEAGFDPEDAEAASGTSIVVFVGEEHPTGPNGKPELYPCSVERAVVEAPEEVERLIRVASWTVIEGPGTPDEEP